MRPVSPLGGFIEGFDEPGCCILLPRPLKKGIMKVLLKVVKLNYQLLEIAYTYNSTSELDIPNYYIIWGIRPIFELRGVKHSSTLYVLALEAIL